MKKLSILIILTLSLSISYAGGEKYVQKMESTIAKLDTASSLNSFLQVANMFERIAAVEKTEWLPSYYAAYAYVIANYMESSKKKRDLILDKAVVLTSESDSLNPDNVEITLLKAYIYSARLSVKPGSRGREYGIKTANMLSKALEMDNNNPRYYLLKGQDLFYTPPMFGGDKQEAKKHFEKALNKYDVFQLETSIHPNWGKDRTEYLLKQCTKEE